MHALIWWDRPSTWFPREKWWISVAALSDSLPSLRVTSCASADKSIYDWQVNPAMPQDLLHKQVSSRCFPYTALRLLAKSQSADGFRLTEERATPNTFMAAGAFLKGTTKGESHVTWGLCVCGGEMEGGGGHRPQSSSPWNIRKKDRPVPKQGRRWFTSRNGFSRTVCCLAKQTRLRRAVVSTYGCVRSPADQDVARIKQVWRLCTCSGPLLVRRERSPAMISRELKPASHDSTWTNEEGGREISCNKEFILWRLNSPQPRKYFRGKCFCNNNPLSIENN